MSIVVSNISKSYGKQKVLDNISFSIEKGEIVGFLGPNGAGKSTLMKILTTYLKPNEGTAAVNDYDIEKATKLVQQSVGYLPEHNPLYLDLYVKEYLTLSANLYKSDKSQLNDIIQQTGLTDEAHKKIGQLSKGYRQRVGLAAAMLHNPEVLILDEPTTGLDPNQLIEIRALIKSIGEEKTILLSTHIMKEVEAICDRVIIINKGVIVADKKIEELRASEQQLIEVEFDYRVEEAFLKRMPTVSSVKNVGGFNYLIAFDTNDDMRPVLFDFAKENGLKTLQINRKNASLESLFVSLTASKEALNQ